MPVTTAEARTLALKLPEAVEQDHHGRPSFRVGGRIFATLWTGDRMNVMVDEDGIRTAVEAVASGQLDPSLLYTHRFPLDQLGEALNATGERPGGFVKAWIDLRA